MAGAMKNIFLIIFLALVLAAWMSAAWTFWAFYLPYIKIKKRLKSKRDVKHQIFRNNKPDLYIQDADSVPRSHGTPGKGRETNQR
jgi:hypothetical protein